MIYQLSHTKVLDIIVRYRMQAVEDLYITKLVSVENKPKSQSISVDRISTLIFIFHQ